MKDRPCLYSAGAEKVANSLINIVLPYYMVNKDEYITSVLIALHTKCTPYLMPLP